VRHESPQVIVLRGGEVAWAAAHFKITAEAVRKALEAAASV
jgi:bacillithiol system protein YtxJ